MSVCEYKDRFNELVKKIHTCLTMTYKSSLLRIFKVQSNMILKLWSLIHLKKTYSMATPFETKSAELAKENRFDVFHKDHSSEKSLDVAKFQKI